MDISAKRQRLISLRNLSLAGPPTWWAEAQNCIGSTSLLNTNVILQLMKSISLDISPQSLLGRSSAWCEEVSVEATTPSFLRPCLCSSGMCFFPDVPTAHVFLPATAYVFHSITALNPSANRPISEMKSLVCNIITGQSGATGLLLFAGRAICTKPHVDLVRNLGACRL